ncbi:MAG: DUF2490 domain-containing protein [Planctomycetota bacterium]|jgi:hypothetical protein
MMQKIVLISGLLLAASLCAGDTDFQHWSHIDGVFNLNEDWIFKVGNQFRFSDSEDFYQHHTDFGFTYTKLAGWLDVGVNYRFIRKKGSDGDWGEENRPHLNFIFKGQVYNIKVSHRLRFEYNDDDDLGDYATIRNKFTLNPEFEDDRDFLPPLPSEAKTFLYSHNVRPFASYEFFADTETNQVSRHRFASGLSVKLNAFLVGDLYYMFEYNRSFADKDDLHVIGASLKFIF